MNAESVDQWTYKVLLKVPGVALKLVYTTVRACPHFLSSVTYGR